MHCFESPSLPSSCESDEESERGSWPGSAKEYSARQRYRAIVGGGQCEYAYRGVNQIGIELWQFQSGAEAWKKFSSELNDSKNATGSQKPTPEAAVGERALSKMEHSPR